MTTVAVCILAAIGILGSWSAWACTDAHVENPKHARMFGRVPWALVGIVGYALILATFPFPLISNCLIWTAGLITIWLVVKAVRIKLGCPLCPALWALNLVLILLSVFRW